MRTGLTICLVLLATGVQADQRAKLPNVVIILADDLGYGDVSCNNPERGKIRTPCIDRLAAQGLRFTDAHSSSGVCSPSRYTLLTGRYHWRSRLQQGIVGLWEAPLIAPDRLTIAGLARQHGYRTMCVGKWHLGEQTNLYAEQPERVAAMLSLLGKLVTDGRSTPGAPQANDVPVRWQRFLEQP